MAVRQHPVNNSHRYPLERDSGDRISSEPNLTSLNVTEGEPSSDSWTGLTASDRFGKCNSFWRKHSLVKIKQYQVNGDVQTDGKEEARAVNFGSNDYFVVSRAHQSLNSSIKKKKARNNPSVLKEWNNQFAERPRDLEYHSQVQRIPKSWKPELDDMKIVNNALIRLQGDLSSPPVNHSESPSRKEYPETESSIVSKTLMKLSEKCSTDMQSNDTPADRKGPINSPSYVVRDLVTKLQGRRTSVPKQCRDVPDMKTLIEPENNDLDKYLLSHPTPFLREPKKPSKEYIRDFVDSSKVSEGMTFFAAAGESKVKYSMAAMPTKNNESSPIPKLVENFSKAVDGLKYNFEEKAFSRFSGQQSENEPRSPTSKRTLKTPWLSPGKGNTSNALQQLLLKDEVNTMKVESQKPTDKSSVGVDRTSPMGRLTPEFHELLDEVLSSHGQRLKQSSSVSFEKSVESSLKGQKVGQERIAQTWAGLPGATTASFSRAQEALNLIKESKVSPHTKSMAYADDVSETWEVKDGSNSNKTKVRGDYSAFGKAREALKSLHARMTVYPKAVEQDDNLLAQQKEKAAHETSEVPVEGQKREPSVTELTACVQTVKKDGVACEALRVVLEGHKTGHNFVEFVPTHHDGVKKEYGAHEALRVIHESQKTGANMLEFTPAHEAHKRNDAAHEALRIIHEGQLTRPNIVGFNPTHQDHKKENAVYEAQEWGLKSMKSTVLAESHNPGGTAQAGTEPVGHDQKVKGPILENEKVKSLNTRKERALHEAEEALKLVCEVLCGDADTGVKQDGLSQEALNKTYRALQTFHAAQRLPGVDAWAIDDNLEVGNQDHSIIADASQAYDFDAGSFTKARQEGTKPPSKFSHQSHSAFIKTSCTDKYTITSADRAQEALKVIRNAHHDESGPATQGDNSMGTEWKPAARVAEDTIVQALIKHQARQEEAYEAMSTAIQRELDAQEEPVVHSQQGQSSPSPQDQGFPSKFHSLLAKSPEIIQAADQKHVKRENGSHSEEVSRARGSSDISSKIHGLFSTSPDMGTIGPTQKEGIAYSEHSSTGSPKQKIHTAAKLCSPSIDITEAATATSNALNEKVRTNIVQKFEALLTKRKCSSSTSLHEILTPKQQKPKSSSEFTISRDDTIPRNFQKEEGLTKPQRVLQMLYNNDQKVGGGKLGESNTKEPSYGHVTAEVSPARGLHSSDSNELSRVELSPAPRLRHMSQFEYPHHLQQQEGFIPNSVEEHVPNLMFLKKALAEAQTHVPPLMVAQASVSNSVWHANHNAQKSRLIEKNEVKIDHNVPPKEYKIVETFSPIKDLPFTYEPGPDFPGKGKHFASTAARKAKPLDEPLNAVKAVENKKVGKPLQLIKELFSFGNQRDQAVSTTDNPDHKSSSYVTHCSLPTEVLKQIHCSPSSAILKQVRVNIEQGYTPFRKSNYLSNINEESQEGRQINTLWQENLKQIRHPAGSKKEIGGQHMTFEAQKEVNDFKDKQQKLVKQYRQKYVAKLSQKPGPVLSEDKLSLNDELSMVAQKSLKESDSRMKTNAKQLHAGSFQKQGGHLRVISSSSLSGSHVKPLDKLQPIPIRKTPTAQERVPNLGVVSKVISSNGIRSRTTSPASSKQYYRQRQRSRSLSSIKISTFEEEQSENKVISKPLHGKQTGSSAKEEQSQINSSAIPNQWKKYQNRRFNKSYNSHILQRYLDGSDENMSQQYPSQDQQIEKIQAASVNSSAIDSDNSSNTDERDQSPRSDPSVSEEVRFLSMNGQLLDQYGIPFVPIPVSDAHRLVMEEFHQLNQARLVASAKESKNKHGSPVDTSLGRNDFKSLVSSSPATHEKVEMFSRKDTKDDPLLSSQVEPLTSYNGNTPDVSPASSTATRVINSRTKNAYSILSKNNHSGSSQSVSKRFRDSEAFSRPQDKSEKPSFTPAVSLKEQERFSRESSSSSIRGRQKRLSKSKSPSENGIRQDSVASHSENNSDKASVLLVERSFQEKITPTPQKFSKSVTDSFEDPAGHRKWSSVLPSLRNRRNQIQGSSVSETKGVTKPDSNLAATPVKEVDFENLQSDSKQIPTAQKEKIPDAEHHTSFGTNQTSKFGFETAGGVLHSTIHKSSTKPTREKFKQSTSGIQNRSLSNISVIQKKSVRNSKENTLNPLQLCSECPTLEETAAQHQDTSDELDLSSKKKKHSKEQVSAADTAPEDLRTVPMSRDQNVFDKSKQFNGEMLENLSVSDLLSKIKTPMSLYRNLYSSKKKKSDVFCSCFKEHMIGAQEARTCVKTGVDPFQVGVTSAFSSCKSLQCPCASYSTERTGRDFQGPPCLRPRVVETRNVIPCAQNAVSTTQKVVSSTRQTSPKHVIHWSERLQTRRRNELIEKPKHGNISDYKVRSSSPPLEQTVSSLLKQKPKIKYVSPRQKYFQIKKKKAVSPAKIQRKKKVGDSKGKQRSKDLSSSPVKSVKFTESCLCKPNDTCPVLSLAKTVSAQTDTYINRGHFPYMDTRNQYSVTDRSTSPYLPTYSSSPLVTQVSEGPFMLQPRKQCSVKTVAQSEQPSGKTLTLNGSQPLSPLPFQPNLAQQLYSSEKQQSVSYPHHFLGSGKMQEDFQRTHACLKQPYYNKQSMNEFQSDTASTLMFDYARSTPQPKGSSLEQSAFQTIVSSKDQNDKSQDGTKKTYVARPISPCPFQPGKMCPAQTFEVSTIQKGFQRSAEPLLFYNEQGTAQPLSLHGQQGVSGPVFPYEHQLTSQILSPYDQQYDQKEVSTAPHDPLGKLRPSSPYDQKQKSRPASPYTLGASQRCKSPYDQHRKPRTQPLSSYDQHEIQQTSSPYDCQQLDSVASTYGSEAPLNYSVSSFEYSLPRQWTPPMLSPQGLSYSGQTSSFGDQAMQNWPYYTTSQPEYQLLSRDQQFMRNQRPLTSPHEEVPFLLNQQPQSLEDIQLKDAFQQQNLPLLSDRQSPRVNYRIARPCRLTPTEDIELEKRSIQASPLQDARLGNQSKQSFASRRLDLLGESSKLRMPSPILEQDDSIVVENYEGTAVFSPDGCLLNIARACRDRSRYMKSNRVDPFKFFGDPKLPEAEKGITDEPDLTLQSLASSLDPEELKPRESELGDVRLSKVPVVEKQVEKPFLPDRDTTKQVVVHFYDEMDSHTPSAMDMNDKEVGATTKQRNSVAVSHNPEGLLDSFYHGMKKHRVSDEEYSIRQPIHLKNMAIIPSDDKQHLSFHSLNDNRSARPNSDSLVQILTKHYSSPSLSHQNVNDSQNARHNSSSFVEMVSSTDSASLYRDFMRPTLSKSSKALVVPPKQVWTAESQGNKSFHGWDQSYSDSQLRIETSVKTSNLANAEVNTGERHSFLNRGTQSGSNISKRHRTIKVHIKSPNLFPLEKNADMQLGKQEENDIQCTKLSSARNETYQSSLNSHSSGSKETNSNFQSQIPTQSEASGVVPRKIRSLRSRDVEPSLHQDTAVTSATTKNKVTTYGRPVPQHSIKVPLGDMPQSPSLPSQKLLMPCEDTCVENKSEPLLTCNSVAGNSEKRDSTHGVDPRQNCDDSDLGVVFYFGKQQQQPHQVDRATPHQTDIKKPGFDSKPALRFSPKAGTEFKGTTSVHMQSQRCDSQLDEKTLAHASAAESIQQDEQVVKYGSTISCNKEGFTADGNNHCLQSSGGTVVSKLPRDGNSLLDSSSIRDEKITHCNLPASPEYCDERSFVSMQNDSLASFEQHERSACTQDSVPFHAEHQDFSLVEFPDKSERQPSLQEALLKKNPKFFKQAEKRRRKLNDPEHKKKVHEQVKAKTNAVQLTSTITSWMKLRSNPGHKVVSEQRSESPEVVSSAERKQKAKVNYSRSNRLYNQLEEVKKKQQDKERKEALMLNRQRRKEFEMKLAAKRKRSREPT